MRVGDRQTAGHGDSSSRPFAASLQCDRVGAPPGTGTSPPPHRWPNGDQPASGAHLPRAASPWPCSHRQLQGKAGESALTWTGLLRGQGPAVTATQAKAGEARPASPRRAASEARLEGRGWNLQAAGWGGGSLLQPLPPPLTHTADGLPTPALRCLSGNCAPASAPLLNISNATPVLPSP